VKLEDRVNRIAIHSTLGLALAVAFTPGWAAGSGKLSQAQQTYQQERAVCLRGASHQDRATCLKEAGAAYEEARRGRLGTASAPDLAGNATRRCEAQPAADRAACAQRILGAGTAEGSVEGGGLLRQTETTTK
jgi:hypothetical protein